jgi:hypothetical protein
MDRSMSYKIPSSIRDNQGKDHTRLKKRRIAQAHRPGQGRALGSGEEMKGVKRTPRKKGSS